MKYAQYYRLIYDCTVKSYEHIIPIIENIFLKLSDIAQKCSCTWDEYMDLYFQMN